MTKYTPITFTKLSEAIAYLEDGGELFSKIDTVHVKPFYAGLVDRWDCGTKSFQTKAKPAPWYEKLDGTVENGVLCWVDDFNSPGANSPTSQAAVVVSFDKNRIGSFVDNVENGHIYATPLTRAEIQRFIGNAVEEI